MKSGKKGNVFLFISAIIGLAYSIYLIIYFGGAFFSTETAEEAFGNALATALITPHLISVAAAAIFNTVAALADKRWAALVGAILYCVSALLFPLYMFIVIPSVILSFIGFVRFGKQNKQNAQVAKNNVKKAPTSKGR